MRSRSRRGRPSTRDAELLEVDRAAFSEGGAPQYALTAWSHVGERRVQARVSGAQWRTAFGRWIRAKSPASVAKRADVTVPTVRDLVLGRRAPSPQLARRLVRISRGSLTLAAIERHVCMFVGREVADVHGDGSPLWRAQSLPPGDAIYELAGLPPEVIGLQNALLGHLAPAAAAAVLRAHAEAPEEERLARERLLGLTSGTDPARLASARSI